jgi:hypothetical protein
VAVSLTSMRGYGAQHWATVLLATLVTVAGGAWSRFFFIIFFFVHIFFIANRADPNFFFLFFNFDLTQPLR